MNNSTLQSIDSQSHINADMHGDARGNSVVGRRLPIAEGCEVLPASNTGALRANDSDLAYPDGFALAPTIDWLAFTIHPQDFNLHQHENPTDPTDDILFLKDSLIAHFGGGEAMPSGVNGYRSSSSILGSGRVAWHVERAEMGVHVIMPSTALARWSQISGQTIHDFLFDVAARGAKFTRVDLALDTDQVTMDTVVEAHEADLTVTKTQDSQLIKNYKNKGLTLYIGSRSGRRMIRFYDKAAQTGTEGVWSRCEVEFKQEHAKTAIEHLLSGVDPRELILASIDFRNHDNPEVKRRSRCDWWQTWVTVVAKVQFPIVKKLADVADAMAWVLHQVAPTLAFLSSYVGNTYWLDNVIHDAIERVPSWRWDLLSAAEPV